MSPVPIPNSIVAPSPTRPPRRWRWSFDAGLSRRPHWIWIFAAALNLLVAGTAWHQITSERTDELVRAAERTRLATVALRAHLERTFDLAEANMRGLDDTAGTAPLNIDRSRPDLRARLAGQVAAGRPFVNMLIVDATGKVAVNALDLPGPLDLSDRSYFARHRDDRSPDLLISAPVVSRPSGFVVVPISKRVETRDGTFDGMVAAGLRSDHLIDLYRSLQPLSVSAHLLDGTTLARSPETSQVGQGLAANDPLMRNLAIAPAGTFETGADGNRRIVSYARLDHWPIMVAVEMDRHAALAGWRSSRQATLILALVFAATVAAAFAVIHRQLMQLAAARVAAEAADRAKSHFLAHMSHELRTPLNAVIGFAEVMGQEVFGPLGSPRYRQYAGDIRVSGEHLLSTITGILDLAKVSTGHWRIDSRLVSPSEIAADVRRQLAPEATARQVALAVDVPPSLPTFRSDRRVIGQILRHLIGTALRSTPEGGAVQLTATASEAMLVFQVTDTGPGMSRDEIRLALEPFGNAQKVLTTKSRDTGLGLPLARSFAELLGGRLKIDSGEGRGTVVTVVLPLGNITLS